MEYVALFFQTYLEHFAVVGKAVMFSWANTCSKMRIDEFSGGVCVVTHAAIEFLDSDAWAAETRERLLKGVIV